MKSKAVGLAITSCVMVGMAAQFFADTPPTATQPNQAITPASHGLFAASFSGTKPDGQFRLIGDRLQLDSRLLEFFDYYLTALGERSLPDIRKQIEIELDHNLPALAATEAKQLLERYINYRAALTDIDKYRNAGSDVIDALRQRLTAVRNARSRHFSPEQVKALFGSQQLDEEQALARLEIQQDPNLTPDQKASRLLQLDAQLTHEQRREREAPVQHALLEQEVLTARKNGASDAQIYQLRTHKLGAEAAERLSVVDKEELQWRTRIDSYLAERNILQTNAQLPSADRDQAISRLRNERFSEQEQLRLSAFEEAGANAIH